MKKRIGVLFCALLAMVALTLSFALPASAADARAEPQADTQYVIAVYFYDASGKMIEELHNTPLVFKYGLDYAQEALTYLTYHAGYVGAASTEVRLLADVPTALSVPAGVTTTLNLNGFTLSAADDTAPLTVAEGGALTIIDTSTDNDTSTDKSGKIAYTGSAVVSAIENHGRLTIETANVTTKSSTALISNSGDTARIAVKGGNFDTNGAGNFANDAGARIAVSGGIFTEKVLGEYCAAGYEPQTLVEGSQYSVTLSAYDNRFGETLTVVGQAAVTEGGTQYYPIDVVCGIDALNYTAVGVEYRVIRTGAFPLDTKDNKKESRTVYKMLYLTIGGEQSTCAPADLGASYLYTARLLLGTAAYTEANTVIRITPYAIGTDGTEYRGRTIELDGDVCADNGTALFAKGE